MTQLTATIHHPSQELKEKNGGCYWEQPQSKSFMYSLLVFHGGSITYNTFYYSYGENAKFLMLGLMGYANMDRRWIILLIYILRLS